ncbi:hypothetical protein LINGRAHAP2_LOCUS30268 [Linum grandiflorum]
MEDHKFLKAERGDLFRCIRCRRS